MPTSPRGLHAVPTPPPALTVAAVARKLGVAPSTLRTWDRRYGLGPSEHVAGSHRRYGADDVTRLVVMRRLTLEGVPPAQAAALAVQAQSASAAAEAVVAHTPAATAAWATVTALPSAPPRPADAADCGRGGGGRVIALGDVTPAARGLARAALSLDGHEIGRVVREAVDSLGVVRAWDDVLAPVLRAVGIRWEMSGQGVEVEHALSEAVIAVMRGLTAQVDRPRNASRILLGCGENDQHSLPLHVLAAALAEDGVGCRMFGLGMPAAALLTAVRRCGPAVVFLHAQLPVADGSVLEEIPRLRPAPHLLLGGPGWEGVAAPRHARALVSLAESVDEILSLVC